MSRAYEPESLTDMGLSKADDGNGVRVHQLPPIDPTRFYEWSVKEIEWASEHWLGKREPVPTTKVAKCVKCEYRNECTFSLVSKKRGR